MVTDPSKNRLMRAAVAAVLAVTAVAGAGLASEPDPAVGLAGRASEAGQLLR